jgi:prephenate dehydrogenase
MDILVVGAGSMGRWLARTLHEDASEPVTTAFLDTDVRAAREAAQDLDCRAVAPDTGERFDAVCIAVPIPVTDDAIATHASRAERAVFDVTGTMADPVRTMREHAPDCERVSFHPLFAPPNEPGNVPLVPDEPGPVTDAVRDALTARDNDLFETTPAEHDEAMETVQARTHAAVLAYALAAEDISDQFHTPISEELAALAAQVTDGDPRVYADVQTAFDGADDLATAARRLADADMETFYDLYDEAGR